MRTKVTLSMLCCYFDILTASWLQISFKLLGRGREILLLYIKINTINYPFVKSQILRAKQSLRLFKPCPCG